MAGLLVAKSKTERDQITVPFSLEPQRAAFKAKTALTLISAGPRSIRETGRKLQSIPPST